MIFLFMLCGLVLIALSLHKQSKNTVEAVKYLPFENLQKNYLRVYYLATFSDWLQGPYVYKLYSDYGFEEEEIAVLYIAGFASSSLFGVVVGHIADMYGRKLLCFSFGFFYSLCCLTKISSSFYVLFLGRVLGGISTSILFSTFEAWYINEHLNHLNLAVEWLNITFSKAGFFTGVLAIVAGIISQICADNLNLGSVSPFLLAIPFLMTASYLICRTWTEHTYSRTYTSSRQGFTAPLHLIFFKDPLLLILGLIQSMFEAVMYTFIFSWTPIISELNPPIGIVFACFMLSFMVGSKLYSMLLSDRLPPQSLLVASAAVSFLSLSAVGIIITYILYSEEQGSLSTTTRSVLVQLCFIGFVLYETCLGMYIPAIGYLKGRVIPEEFRASIANWFRLPMNIFTCISLTLNQLSKYNVKDSSQSVIVFKTFHLMYFLCSIFLLLTTVTCVIFKRKYTRRFSREESFNITKDVINGEDPSKDIII